MTSDNLEPNDKFQLMLDAAYEYYHEYNNIMTDLEYDLLTQEVFALKDKITHSKKDLVDWGSLKTCSSLFYIPKNKYQEF